MDAKARVFELFWSENRYDFDHYTLKSGMAFKETTRASKRMKNGMFWSEIASRFKKRNVTPPSTIPRTTPTPRTEPTLFNISFATHARINEIKNGFMPHIQEIASGFCMFSFISHRY